MQIQRSIGPVSLLFTAVGGIVGSGWLFGPFYTAQVSGPAAIISWIVGGILMMIIALTFAELATMLPITGSMVRFTEFSHGPLVGFTMAWISWLSAVIVAPIETLALLQYAENYFPGLIRKVGNAHLLTGMGTIIAGLIMLLMCFLNLIGTRILAKTNNIIVSWKLLIPIATVFIFLSTKFHIENFTQFGGFAPTGVKGILSALPTAGVIFSFIGYSTAILLAGEAKNPQKWIPFAVIGSLGICIILYTLIQIAFIGALSPEDLANGWQHLSFKGDSGPFAGIAVALGLAWFVNILYSDAIISPFGTGFIYTAATARINYAASKNGYFPEFFQRLNSKGMPHISILTNFLVGMIFFLPFPSWQSLVEFLVSAFVAAYAVGPIALIVLRYKEPELHRPFKLPAAYAFCLLAFYCCNLIVLWTGWNTVWRMLIAIAVGYIYLIFFKRSTSGKTMDLKWKQGYWIFPHFIGLGIISFLSSFGGGMDVIAFGWDFVVTALFTIVIFHLATQQRFHLQQDKIALVGSSEIS